jgi:hypothetical protein
MDHHLRRPDGFAGLERLQEALGDHRAHQRITAIDLKPPEWPVNPKPSAIAVKQPFEVGGDVPPAAIKRGGIDEILEFKIALLLDNPAAIDREALAIHGRADNRR